ncbi:regulatory protein ral2 [Marasmius fiardii PR-910]|nr:regulatory protein ral2 [Marasmius fiardii PR-910]
MLHSIYDLTTSCRKTSGDVPAKLVGASTTVVGSKMYLFGGRLVTERKMVSDLYVFDLESFVWEKIQPFPEDDVPRPRYFHSADAWNNQLIIFGGMSNQPDSHNPDELCVLNDVRFFDLSTRHWILPSQFPTPVSETFVPRARYAHLSSVTADRLFIIGGQDFFNTWLDDICVYDLLGKTWVQRRDYPRHCGTYRSVAVASNLCVRRPHEEKRDSSNLGAPGTRFRNTDTPTQADFTPTDSLVHLPYSTAPTEDFPSNIYLYSNYNFTDVKRELEVFSPLPDTDFTIQDRSAAMNGSTFPPGLRFPTGAILGSHLIIAGTYLAHTYQSFSIWVLDLLSMTWTRIDPGKAVEGGSWFRGCLWADANKFLIFGNRNGNLVDDYNRRLLSWDHVAVVDLEAFGIYQPPPLKLSLEMQELGLAALEEDVLTDFELICDDGRKISCSRKILEERWPWFKDQMKKFLQVATNTCAQLPTSPMHVDNPILPGAASTDEQRTDPRLTPRSLQLSEPYPITLALVRYFYTLALLTPLQLAPAVLSQLLVLATNYRISHLESLVKHAMHRALSNSTSVGVYEVATLCGCRSLQIRALRTVMTYTQKKPGSRRNDRENGSGSRPPDGGSGGGLSGSGNEGSGYDKSTSRPRGTSDARWRTGESDTNNVYSKEP